MMERILMISGGLIVTVVVLLMAWNVAHDPQAARRAYLTEQLAGVSQAEFGAGAERGSFNECYTALVSKQKVWDSLAPAPPVETGTSAPDLRAMLQKVTPMRGQVGDKIKIQLPKEDRPVYLGIGETVNGCKLKSFDDASAVFSYYWKEEDRELTLRLPRK